MNICLQVCMLYFHFPLVNIWKWNCWDILWGLLTAVAAPEAGAHPVVHLWSSRVDIFGPFQVDNGMVQIYLKFGKFWVSIIDLLFQMWSPVSVP